MANKSRRLSELTKAVKEERWHDVSEICIAKPDIINTVTKEGENPLIHAVRYGAPEKILLQLMKNANKDTINNSRLFGRTILHRFTSLGYASALDRALEISRDNINAQDLVGDTPLHELLRSNGLTYEEHKEMTNILLDSGLITTIKNWDGKTPIDYYKNNKCLNYDENKRKQNKAELLLLLEAKGKVIPVEILARGPAALNAFVEALQEGQVEVRRGRTIVMGLERVGKTSTINSFLKKKFNPNEPITDAIATNKTYIHNSPDVWNEAVQDKPPVTVIYEEKVAESIAEKVSDHSQEAENTIESQDNSQPSTSTQPVIPESIASITEKKLRSRSRNMSKMKAPTNEFIMDIWDFGGQPIYNVIQRIFIPSFAVVCVVFNLEHDLDQPALVRDPTTGKLYEHRMTYLDYILYWIRSAYINCRHYELDGILGPPIILVGTHRNSLGRTEKKRISKIKIMEEKIWKALMSKPYEKMVFQKIFTIENSSPNNRTADIKKVILRFSKKMVRHLPLKWLQVQQEIQELRKKHICVETSQIISLIERYGIKGTDQELLLQYLHDIGEILYYSNVRALKDTIVVNLMQVVNLSKAFITVKDPKLADPMLKDSWRTLNSGILKEDLLRHLWGKLGVQDELFDFFVSLLQRFGLLCEKITETGQQREFIVLSRLKPIPVPYEKPKFIVAFLQRIGLLSVKEVPKDQYTHVISRMEPEPALEIMEYGDQAISLIHDFNNYLPEDVFQRAVTKFIERFQNSYSEPKLCYEHVELNIDEKHYVILSVDTIEQRRMFKTTIIRTKNPNTDSAEEPEARVCKEVLSFLNEELNLFCPESGRGIEVRMYIPCVCCKKFHAVEKFDENVLACGTKAMDVTRYRRLLGDDVSMSHKDQDEEPSTTTIDKTADDFQRMLEQVSTWFDRRGTINKLKVLYKDKVTSYRDLQKAERTIELFRLLQSAGHLKQDNVDILIDTINVTGTMGVLEASELLRTTYENTKPHTHVFTSHRRNLIKFGDVISTEGIRTIGHLKDMIESEYKDQWIMIMNLETMGVIRENGIQSFIGLLRNNNLTLAAEKLEERE